MANYDSNYVGAVVDDAINTVLTGKAGIQGLSVNGEEVEPSEETNKISISVPTVTNYTATLTSANWETSGNVKTQTVSVTGLKSTDTPIIDITSPTESTLSDWALVSKIVTGTDSITATCFGDVPTNNLTIQIKNIA